MSDPSCSSGELTSEFAGDPDMRDIVEMFVTEMPDRVAEIEGLLADGDMAELTRRAHQLKGSAGGYGFPAITKAAAAVETTAQAQGELEALRRQVESLTDLCRRARA